MEQIKDNIITFANYKIGSNALQGVIQNLTKEVEYDLFMISFYSKYIQMFNVIKIMIQDRYGIHILEK